MRKMDLEEQEKNEKELAEYEEKMLEAQSMGSTSSIVDSINTYRRPSTGLSSSEISSPHPQFRPGTSTLHGHGPIQEIQEESQQGSSSGKSSQLSEHTAKDLREISSDDDKTTEQREGNQKSNQKGLEASPSVRSLQSHQPKKSDPMAQD